MVGPTMSPTTPAQCACCRIVTRGRGLWPSARSGAPGQLTVMDLAHVTSLNGTGHLAPARPLQGIGSRTHMARNEAR